MAAVYAKSRIRSWQWCFVNIRFRICHLFPVVSSRWNILEVIILSIVLYNWWWYLKFLLHVKTSTCNSCARSTWKNIETLLCSRFSNQLLATPWLLVFITRTRIIVVYIWTHCSCSLDTVRKGEIMITWNEHTVLMLVSFGHPWVSYIVVWFRAAWYIATS